MFQIDTINKFRGIIIKSKGYKWLGAIQLCERISLNLSIRLQCDNFEQNFTLQLSFFFAKIRLLRR